MANSWQQPNDAEPGMGEWHKVENPGTGYLASKTSGWTADRLSTATGGLAVDFSAVVPAGTRAVLVNVLSATTASSVYTRAKGDTEISNTPHASSEFSAAVALATGRYRVPLLLSDAYEAEFAVANTGTDLYISYPTWYLL